MFKPPPWQPHSLPDDFVPSHLVTGSYGLPMFGGHRHGRAALAFTWPATDPAQVLDLDAGRLLTVASNGGNIIAATADGAMFWAYPPDDFGGPPSCDRQAMPFGPSGEPPVMAWGSSADREFRLVIAYPVGGGFELCLFSEEADDLVPVSNRIFTGTDLSAIQVTSHQGVVLVGGPVSETLADAHGCQVWLCDEPDYGDGTWTRQTLTPAPVALTHQVDQAVHWWWAGHDGERVTVWGENDAVLAPDLPVGDHAPKAFLADTPIGESAPVLAVQDDSGSRVHFLDQGRWVSAPLPEGELRGALRSYRHTDDSRKELVPQRLHVLVDDRAWWMDWDDVHSLARFASRTQ